MFNDTTKLHGKTLLQKSEFENGGLCFVNGVNELIVGSYEIVNKL